MNKQATVTAIANEAVDQLRVAHEYMGWLDSLSWAISSSISKGQEHHAAQLAGVARYLAGDYRNIIDCEIKRLNERLDTLDLRT